MVIKVSTLLAHNTLVVDDLSPTLGGPLNTANFPIVNGGNPVTITGNEYPTNTGTSGQFLTTNGFGNLYWSTVSASGTVTSVSVTTANGISGSVLNPTTTPAITLTLGDITPSSVAATGTITGSNLSGTNTGDQTITLTGDVTGSGTGSFPTTLATVNVSPQIDAFRKITVNGKGLITATSAVTPSDITTALGFTPGTGSVTSVTVDGTAGEITSTGSPITTTGTITLALATTAVTPGSYTNADITVDSFGRIIAASSGSSGGVTQLIAGTNITLSPVGGTGVVTINATGSGNASNILGGLANEILFQSAPNITSFITAPSTAGTALEWDGTNFVWAAAGSGSVTSVGFADTSAVPIYTITNSPITTSGTIDQTLIVQAANTIFAGPVSGPNAEPTFRSLVSADIPNNAANTTGNAATSTTATNIAGGVIGDIPYQLGPGLTGFVAPTITGYVLTLGGSGTYTQPAGGIGGLGTITPGGSYLPNIYDNSGMGVPLTGGFGTGATAIINVNGAGYVAGVANDPAVTILNPGTGYHVGDVLSATTQTGVFSTTGLGTGFAVVVGALLPTGSFSTGTITGLGAIVPSTGPGWTGINYLPGSYLNVPLLGGHGTGALATIVVNGATSATTATITNAGSGYAVGDVLSVSAASLGVPSNPAGSGLQAGGFSVPVTAINAGSGGTTPVWAPVTGASGGTVTSVGLTSTGGTITVSGTPNPITGVGTFNVDLPLSGVTAATYGSASSVGVITVNSQGIVTLAANTSIAITPTQAGLGNVVNSLQVINAGGAPSIQEATGVPSGSAATGAIYIDQAGTNGTSIYFYNGSTWVPISDVLKLYSENWTTGYVPPAALGTNSVAIGEGAQTSATDSFALGLQSLARIQGGAVQASGRFGNTGDAQAGRYLVRNITTNNAPTTLFVDGVGGSVAVNLTDNSTWTFNIKVVGHQTSVGNGHAGYEFSGVIYRMAGAATTAILGQVSKTVLAESNTPWDATVSADTTNGGLKIVVTGETSKIIRWLAIIETVEVTN